MELYDYYSTPNSCFQGPTPVQLHSRTVFGIYFDLLRSTILLLGVLLYQYNGTNVRIPEFRNQFYKT